MPLCLAEQKSECRLCVWKLTGCACAGTCSTSVGEHTKLGFSSCCQVRITQIQQLSFRSTVLEVEVMFRRILDSSSKSRVEHYIKRGKAALTQGKDNYFTRETMLQHTENTSRNFVLLRRGAVDWLTMFLFYIEKRTLLLVGRKTRRV